MKNVYLGIILLLLSFSVTAQGPQTSICFVTVDINSTHNIVIWERVDQISPVAIDSMYIYRRDDASGLDELIDVVDYDSLSEYHDWDVAADPNVKSSLYRIAGKDINGQLGVMSDPARTIFLSYNYSVIDDIFTLSWNPYVGASFTEYICWDVIPTQGNINLLQGVNTSWDFTSIVPGQLYNFMIDLTDMSGCTSTKANHNTTRSNRSTGGVALPVSIKENNITNVKLFPSPTENELNLSFNSKKLSPTEIKIYDLVGELVYSNPIAAYSGLHSLKLDVSDLSSGLYLISLQNGAHTKTLRFSKK